MAGLLLCKRLQLLHSRLDVPNARQPSRELRITYGCARFWPQKVFEIPERGGGSASYVINVLVLAFFKYSFFNRRS